MQNIDINKLNELKEELSKLANDDVLYVNDDDKKYVVMSEELYNILDCYRVAFEEDNNSDESVKLFVNGLNNGFSYDEYENLRKQLIDVFDKAFKPKADKLN